MSTIFLDRDGVINENRSDYVKSWSEFRFLPGSKEAIAEFTRAGHRIVICTNQACIARGIVPVETVEEIHRRMTAEITKAGGIVERIYYCPHGKNEGCFCRKPRPGMLLRARDELGIDLHDSIFIGDSISDIQASLAAGVHPILVLTGLGMEHLRQHYQEANGPFQIAENLKKTTKSILQAGLRARQYIPPASIITDAPTPSATQFSSTVSYTLSCPPVSPIQVGQSIPGFC